MNTNISLDFKTDFLILSTKRWEWLLGRRLGSYHPGGISITDGVGWSFNNLIIVCFAIEEQSQLFLKKSEIPWTALLISSKFRFSSNFLTLPEALPIQLPNFSNASKIEMNIKTVLRNYESKLSKALFSI